MFYNLSCVTLVYDSGIKSGTWYFFIWFFVTLFVELGCLDDISGNSSSTSSSFRLNKLLVLLWLSDLAIGDDKFGNSSSSSSVIKLLLIRDEALVLTIDGSSSSSSTSSLNKLNGLLLFVEVFFGTANSVIDLVGLTHNFFDFLIYLIIFLIY